MRKIVTRTVEYACGVCHTRYASKKQAQRCEAMPKEKKVFDIGDVVIPQFERYCNVQREFYRVRKATIVHIVGPEPTDTMDVHLYKYEVKFTCPLCGGTQVQLYYAPDITKAAPKKGKRA